MLLDISPVSSQPSDLFPCFHRLYAFLFAAIRTMWSDSVSAPTSLPPTLCCHTRVCGVFLMTRLTLSFHSAVRVWFCGDASHTIINVFAPFFHVVIMLSSSSSGPSSWSRMFGMITVSVCGVGASYISSKHSCIWLSGVIWLKNGIRPIMYLLIQSQAQLFVHFDFQKSFSIRPENPSRVHTKKIVTSSLSEFSSTYEWSPPALSLSRRLFNNKFIFPSRYSYFCSNILTDPR